MLTRKSKVARNKKKVHGIETEVFCLNISCSIKPLSFHYNCQIFIALVLKIVVNVFSIWAKELLIVYVVWYISDSDNFSFERNYLTSEVFTFQFSLPKKPLTCLIWNMTVFYHFQWLNEYLSHFAEICS